METKLSTFLTEGSYSCASLFDPKETSCTDFSLRRWGHDQCLSKETTNKWSKGRPPRFYIGAAARNGDESDTSARACTCKASAMSRLTEVFFKEQFLKF